MNRKKIILLGTLTYILGLILFNIFNYTLNIVLPEFKDWELFSFNFYGSLLFYIISMVLYIILFILVKTLKINSLILLVILVLLPEIPAIFMAGNSIIISIFTTMVKDQNYTLLLYPLTIIIAYFLSKKIIDLKMKD
ncbi:hypothetical protein [Tenacibaculum sp. M341]|uniref:hypothetical protein n=1 Tax=Tenacibaculum sp. M341 TaxID=2530339 RepID=UPI001048B1EA|nr:hypothetical protein [Tenacibaculum sp. M341]TCI84446.1 hypothetical protein EYW44_21330 [Tenacibaculum sp. M341]